jgi:uncharacterized protein (TIGR03086 family)
VSELQRLHAEVMQISIAVVSQVEVGDLDRPTPCAGWSLGRLMAHLIGQNYGFAAAADGTGEDRAVFADRPVGEHPAADYAASAERVIAAFNRPGVLDSTIYLAELRGGMAFPASTAIGFHLVDYVVHSWDVARCLGRDVEFSDDALAVALSVAEAVPDQARSLDEAAPFRPSVPVKGDSVLDQIVATLGRAPDWSAPARR